MTTYEIYRDAAFCGRFEGATPGEAMERAAAQHGADAETMIAKPVYKHGIEAPALITAPTFAEFKASRTDMTIDEAAALVDLHPEEFGPAPEGNATPVVLFGGACYAMASAEPDVLIAPVSSTEIVGDEDTVAWGLYWDHYLPECFRPHQLSTAVLVDALEEYAAREGLTLKGPNEMLGDVLESTDLRPLPPKEAAQADNLGSFIRLWEEVMTLENTAPSADDPASWLRTIQGALDDHRAACIPTSAHDAQWSRICASMAWITEALGVDPAELS